MDNFTPLRNGLVDHIQQGKLCPFDLGVYTFLHLHADWASGIYHGCALGIAHGFSDPSLKHHINKSLIRLRERRYINYPKGCGRRGGYPILINKYSPRVGELCGTRLNAWKHGELCRPEYEAWNGGGTVEEQSGNGGGRVGEPYQEIKKLRSKENTNPSAQGKPERVPLGELAALAGQIYGSYPRKIAKDDALRAISKAIQKIAVRGVMELHPDFKGDYNLAAAWLQKRVTLYRDSPQGRRLDKDKIPYPATWMNAGQYDDDPQEWTHVSSSQSAGKSNGKVVVTSNAVEAHKALLRETNTEGVV